MKNAFLLVLVLFLLPICSLAADKVVVIPLNSAQQGGKLWGEGRVGASATLTDTVNGINISRSTGLASWDGVAAACPANTWVCTAAELQGLDTSTETTNVTIIDCVNATSSAPFTWTQDDLTEGFGRTVHVAYDFIAGSNIVDENSQRKCAYLPVWCCSKAQ